MITTTSNPFQKVTRDWSQCGEQPEMLRILAHIGLTHGTVVDLGAGDGFNISNSRALIECGWNSVLIDGREAKAVHRHWITRESIVQVIRQYTDTIDVLCIDLDGNDYWILREVLGAWSPAMIVSEINPRFNEIEAQVAAYDENFKQDGDYYGMSIAALRKLLADRYTIANLTGGINAICVRNDLVTNGVVAPWTYRRKHDHPARDGQWTHV